MSTKVVINGKTVEGLPKSVKLAVAGKEIEITLVYISKEESSKSWTWNPVAGNDKLVAKTSKTGNRVATTLEFEGKAVFTNLTAQSVFAVVNAKFGQSVGTTDSIYKKANPERKESAKGASSKVVITEKGVF
jgi:hypothetical protein